MINIVLACSGTDEESDTDKELRLYFSVCAKDLKKYIKTCKKKYKLHEINADKLNAVYLEMVIERLQPEIYLHGLFAWKRRRTYT